MLFILDKITTFPGISVSEPRNKLELYPELGKYQGNIMNSNSEEPGKDVFNLFYRGLDGKKSIPVSYNPQIVQIRMDLLPFFAQGQNF